MQIVFCGVGEAFDEHHPNTSLAVAANDTKGVRRRVLLDCGFTAAHAFWRTAADPLALDALWISHFHGDHFFGLPLLILRFWEQGRSDKLTIVGQEGIEAKTAAVIELAYPGLGKKIDFPLEFVAAEPDHVLSLCGFEWSFAVNDHSKPCLAVRLDHPDGSIFYSGDGRPTAETLALARGCDLIVHEAFGLDTVPKGHGTVDGCLEFARKTDAKALALVHMSREIRAAHAVQVGERLLQNSHVMAFMPETGQSLTLSDQSPIRLN